MMVPDVYEICDKLEAAGVAFQKKPDGGRMKGLAFALDPDGTSSLPPTTLESLGPAATSPVSTPPAYVRCPTSMPATVSSSFERRETNELHRDRTAPDVSPSPLPPGYWVEIVRRGGRVAKE